MGKAQSPSHLTIANHYSSAEGRCWDGRHPTWLQPTITHLQKADVEMLWSLTYDVLSLWHVHDLVFLVIPTNWFGQLVGGLGLGAFALGLCSSAAPRMTTDLCFCLGFLINDCNQLQYPTYFSCISKYVEDHRLSVTWLIPYRPDKRVGFGFESICVWPDLRILKLIPNSKINRVTWTWPLSFSGFTGWPA